MSEESAPLCVCYRACLTQRPGDTQSLLVVVVVHYVIVHTRAHTHERTALIKNTNLAFAVVVLAKKQQPRARPTNRNRPSHHQCRVV